MYTGTGECKSPGIDTIRLTLPFPAVDTCLVKERMLRAIPSFRCLPVADTFDPAASQYTLSWDGPSFLSRVQRMVSEKPPRQNCWLGGAEVILHGRNQKKGKQVQRELVQKAGADRPDLFIADYSRQDNIRRMATDIISNYSRLDVLINNVGTFERTRHETENGIEMTFAVNYLGPFLLTHLLLPLLRRVLRPASLPLHRALMRMWTGSIGTIFRRNADSNPGEHTHFQNLLM